MKSRRDLNQAVEVSLFFAAGVQPDSLQRLVSLKEFSCVEKANPLAAPGSLILSQAVGRVQSSLRVDSLRKRPAG